MKIKGYYAIIETVEEAVRFDHVTHMFLYDLLDDWSDGNLEPSASDVFKVITPKKGRQVRVINPNLPDSEHPYLCTYDEFVDIQKQFPDVIGVDDNAITVGTCGEIRNVLKAALSGATDEDSSLSWRVM